MYEVEITRRFQHRALKDGRLLSFVGAGAYHHHIPVPVSLQSNPFTTSTVGENASRQAGGLAQQLSNLTAMSATRCAGGDLITATAKGIEIIQNALKRRKTNRILIASTVNPYYRKAIGTRLKHQGLDLAIVHYDEDAGTVGVDQLSRIDRKSADVLIIQYPNFFGVIEAADEISDWAFSQDIPLITVINPLALGVLKAPGSWGKRGAEMAVYDIQTLGLPASLSGSVAGFVSIKRRLANKLTDDIESTLSALEMQQLDNWMLARAETFLNYQGDIGLSRIAQQCARNLKQLENRLLENPLLSARFAGKRFHECVIEFDQVNLPAVSSLCAQHGFQIGHPLESEYHELGRCVLFNATEAHLDADIEAMVGELSKVIELQSRAGCLAAAKF